MSERMDLQDNGAQESGPDVKYASFGKRLLSYLIDGLIIAAIGAVAGVVIGILGLEILGNIIGVPIAIGYFGYFWTSTGATIGKSVLKLKVVDADGNLISWGGAILRYVGYIVSAVALMLGFIWIIFDAKNQGWHDKIAGTFVIDEK